MTELRTLHEEMEMRVAGSSRAQLVQCARLLAMYLAIYKCRFGEIPNEDYEAVAEAGSARDAGAQVFALGLAELNEMLRLIGGSQLKPELAWPTSKSIN